MKVTAVKLKTAVFIALATWSINSFAQVDTIMYVMKNGEVIFQSPISDIDNITFDKATSDSTLIVQKNDGSSDSKILLNNIQQVSFSDENLSIETSNGSETYAFDSIAKLLFGDGNNTGIDNLPAQNSFDVLVYVNPTGDMMVKSPAAIKSLTVFNVDGKMIFKQHYNDVNMQCIVSLQNSASGVYLLRVETKKGTVIKKVVKSLNK